MKEHAFAPNRGRWECLVVVALLAVVTCGFAAHGGNTYITDLNPDPSVTEPDCYPFDITVTQASGASP